MEKIITSPFIKAIEMQMVYDRIESCSSMDDMGNITKVVDEFEKSQPEEKEIIKDMRNLVCDLTFQFYLEKYAVC